MEAAKKEVKPTKRLTEKEKVFVGVDCHKETIACYINGNFKEFKTNFKGFKKALEWAKKIEPNSHWAIEGAYSYGLMFSSFLLNSGCKVYEFNALTTSKARKVLSISGEKNDYGDAKVISIFAKHAKLNEVSLKTIALKKKITARKLLVKQRTELINNIKASFNHSEELLPFNSLTTLKAANWLIRRNNLEISVLGEILQKINNAIKLLEKEIETILPKEAKKLTQITGIQTLTAGVIYAELKGKKLTKAQLASYSGVAPVECSSGLSTNFRNNKRGNRILNSVLYSVSLHQSRFDKIGSEYFFKKLNEGKSKRHARKCLARQVSNVIWKVLFAD